VILTWLVQGNEVPPASKKGICFIDCDAGEPCEEARPALEPVKILKRSQVRLLQDILDIVGTPQEAVQEFAKPLVVALCQNSVEFAFSGLHARDCLSIAESRIVPRDCARVRVQDCTF
jgi:hypothetical protein